MSTDFSPASHLLHKSSTSSETKNPMLLNDEHGDALTPPPLSAEKSLEFNTYFGELEEDEQDPFDDDDDDDGDGGDPFEGNERVDVNMKKFLTPERRWTMIETPRITGGGSSTMLVQTPNFLPFEKEWTARDWIARLTPNWKFVLWAVILLILFTIFSDELIPDSLREWWQDEYGEYARR